MNLYVWQAVLIDYTSGIICVLASSESEAWRLLYDYDELAWSKMADREDVFDADEEFTMTHGPNAINPRCVTKPEAFVVWGGA